MVELPVLLYIFLSHDSVLTNSVTGGESMTREGGANFITGIFSCFFFFSSSFSPQSIRIISGIACCRSMGGNSARAWGKVFRHNTPGLVVVMVNLAVAGQILFQLWLNMMSWEWDGWKWSWIMQKMPQNEDVSWR